MTHRILAVCAVLALAAAAPAQWKGSEEVRDGVTYVSNPAQPTQAPSAVQLEELWRIGGYEDDEIFGVITSVLEGNDGNLYMLDAQLNEVKVYGPDGEYLRSIGRQGEGPGEFRGGSSSFLTPAGEIAVLQAFPPKIVLLTPEGDPAGEYPMPKMTGQGFQIMVGAQLCGDNVAMMQMHNRQLEDGTGFIMREVLTLSPKNSSDVIEVASAEAKLDFNNIVMAETEFSGMRNGRWAAIPDGRVVAAPDYLEYKIDVYGPDGKLQQVVTRDYPPHKRTSDEKAFVETIFQRATASMPFPNKQFVISDIHNPIGQLLAREDGSLWVATSRGRFDRSEDSIGVYDVYDSAGHFAQQIDLKGEADPWDDLILFVGDHLLVVTDWLPAVIALQGGGAGADEELEEEVEPMQVICYRLDVPKFGLN